LAAQPRIFDRFYSTRGAQNGLGLQLAMVRAIAEAHGGSAEVTSTSGIGATFKIALPRQSAPRDP
jgi:signal transduction histidine kinase